MKKFRICLALLMAMLMVGGSALAAASVTYEGGAEKFVFLPGSDESETDLFENFKGVMPGDEIEQKITVKNDTKGKVRIYMRADPVSAADEEFLNQMHITVKAGSKKIFDAAAGEQDGLSKNTLLGTFKKNGKTELTVTLTVPIEMGNEYMDEAGTIPWVFLAEEIEEDDTPKTGDWFRMELWLGIAAVLAAAIIVLIFAKRRRGNEE
jgi:hypothetical protein